MRGTTKALHGREFARPAAMSPHRIFLLSPAHCGGKRADLLIRPEAGFDLAARLRSSAGAPIGEVFSFLSGLYFRGKSTYARTFAAPPPGLPGSLVITSGRGLLALETPITLQDLAFFAGIPIDAADPRYRRPLEEGVRRLMADLPDGAELVLLGSIATSKYIEVLLDILGDRLCFPEAFVGMGDMQRGSLLLRASQAGVQLPYIRAAGAVRSRAVTRDPPVG